MNFELNEDQLQIKYSIREFAESEIRPNVMEWDEAQHFPIGTAPLTLVLVKHHFVKSIAEDFSLLANVLVAAISWKRTSHPCGRAGSRTS